MPRLWKCPRCGRTFRRVNQAHSCGRGSRKGLLAGKPEHVVKLYQELERTTKSLKGVEVVHRAGYVLFRTSRIFADLTLMKDAVRLNVVLDRKVTAPVFFKTVPHGGRMCHVAKLKTLADLRAVKPYLKQAHRFALSE